MTERPAAEPGAGEPPVPVVRRRLQSANSEDSKGRGGCLATGALLGIIIGVMFALYGLGPILRHFYGEEKIDVNVAWVDGEQSLRAQSVRVGIDDAAGGTNVPVVFVTFESQGFAENEPRPARFRLEVDGVEEWVLPLPRLPNAPTAAAGAAEFTLRYPVPAGLDPSTVRPVAVHLEEPLIRFALGEVERE